MVRSHLWRSTPLDSLDIAIVGAGFSGTLLAINLLRSTGEPVALAPATLALIERRPRLAQGLAYSTESAGHLLNVRAGNMSAFPDRPNDFVDWMERSGTGPTAASAGFASRHAYGLYLRTRLSEALRAAPRRRLRPFRGEVVALRRDGGLWRVVLADGRQLAARRVVLALGNFPPPPPFDTTRLGRAYRNDPWAPGALEEIDPDRPVVLIGSGLTAVDVALSLIDRGQRAPIHMISRRGLLPHAHAAGGAWPAFLAPPYPGTASLLLRRVRDEVRRAEAAGAGWRAVIDSLRPLTTALWQSLRRDERARLLRHLRPWWDVHRHRLAPAVAERIAQARASGLLSLRAARFLEARPSAGGLLLTLRARGGKAAEEMEVGTLINCGGQETRLERVGEPLLRGLLEDGLAAADALGLGLDVTGDGQLLDARGQPVPGLHAVGPLTRAASWEITAVPDIRVQCRHLAERLAVGLADAA